MVVLASTLFFVFVSSQIQRHDEKLGFGFLTMDIYVEKPKLF